LKKETIAKQMRAGIYLLHAADLGEGGKKGRDRQELEIAVLRD
jgi:hypothetical protein